MTLQMRKFQFRSTEFGFETFDWADGGEHIRLFQFRSTEFGFETSPLRYDE